MRFETLAVHAGSAVDAATGAVTPPIHLSTTFEREEDGSYPRGYVYARQANPNRAALERSLAALDGGAVAAAFASGQAATASCLQALSPGDHVVLPMDAYYGTATLLRDIFGRWGLEHTLADMRDPSKVAAAMRPTTRLVWVETPSNPLLRITDIAAVADVAHAGGARLACDNTWATPALCRPLELGADLVMHATTKYLGGHSDVVGGAIVSATPDLAAKVAATANALGTTCSPYDAWLVLRGVKTLPLRMQAHEKNATALAHFLNAHPQVEHVYYPGLPTHPQHALARSQQHGFGAMLSFDLKGGEEAVFRLVERLKLYAFAESLGGVESLIEHPARMTHASTATGPFASPPNLVRLSVGIESADDLVADLEQALASVHAPV